MTTITVEHATLSFRTPGQRHPLGHVLALDDVSVRVEAGRVLALMGPSGCGKSSLLRAIAGLLTLDSGRVLHDGVPIADVPLAQRGIGMVFQEGALIPHWRARDSVGFFLRLRQRDHEVDARVREVAAITGVGLEALLARRPKQLSGGEAQRVAIARALARDLRVLLCDEPFANLDAALRQQARHELRKLLQRFPVTTVLATHDQHEAVALADRIALLRAGRVVQTGTYRQLYEQPQDLFVATFIGTPPMNLFHGHAVGGQWRGQNFGPLPLRRDLADGTPVVLGVRAEHITLAAPSAVEAAHALPHAEARVELVTPLYAERAQRLDVLGNGERWQCHAPALPIVHPRERVLCVLPDGAPRLFFASQTGARVG